MPEVSTLIGGLCRGTITLRQTIEMYEKEKCQENNH